MASITVGVLSLQGGFLEHITLLRRAGSHLCATDPTFKATTFSFIEVRTPEQLAVCDGLIIPGGESTTMALVAAQSGLIDPLRDFVKVQKKPTWGTCAGLILLSDQANATKQGGQELIGGLGVRVHRNHFGRQIESFEADLSLPFLSSSGSPSSFSGVFIRAPVVEEVVGGNVEVLAKLPGRLDRMKKGVSVAETKDDSGDIVAVRQDNILGMSFHPELTSDERIHVWWLRELVKNMS